MLMSELFGTDHRDKEIDKQQQRDDAHDDCFHRVLLQPFAKTHVKNARDEKRNDGCGKDQVAHK
jgi:hypothetical protein